MKLSCPYADKIFIAYFVASYLNAVAEAGKAKRPVLMAANSYLNAVAEAGKAKRPVLMAANCWLDKGEVAGKFPSGGPVSRVMEV